MDEKIINLIESKYLSDIKVLAFSIEYGKVIYYYELGSIYRAWINAYNFYDNNDIRVYINSFESLYTYINPKLKTFDIITKLSGTKYKVIGQDKLFFVVRKGNGELDSLSINTEFEYDYTNDNFDVLDKI